MPPRPFTPPFMSVRSLPPLPLPSKLHHRSAPFACPSQYLCSKGLGTLFTLPFLGLTGLITVPANTTVAIFRFGA